MSGLFEELADSVQEMAQDAMAAMDGDDGLMQGISDWLVQNPVSVQSVPGTSRLDIAVGGSDYVAVLDDQGVRVFDDPDNDGGGNDLLFAGSAALVPEGVQLSYDADGDGVPDTAAATLTPFTTLADIGALFL